MEFPGVVQKGKMKEIFDDYVVQSFGEEKQAVFKFKQFEKNYQKYFPENYRAKLLDIGIGRGEMLTMMKKWGYENCLGIDISPSTVKFCKNIKLNALLVDSSFDYLKEHEEQYDVITMLDVLEHIKKQEIIPYLKALKAALIEGGVLIVQVPNAQSPDGQLHRYNDITHEVSFGEHSLAQVLLAAGFTKFKFHGFEQFVFGTLMEYARRFVRTLHWVAVRLLRGADGNVNPRILNPIFYAVVYK
jgi:2-polyprenyl-3-methyl-5-hydroxy-6-metoxy-1,4-benzoquinol methylase